MKRYIFFLLFIYNFSINAETYKCELKNNQNIVFDRSGHSHFKKCIDKICDKNTNQTPQNNVKLREGSLNF